MESEYAPILRGKTNEGSKQLSMNTNTEFKHEGDEDTEIFEASLNNDSRPFSRAFVPVINLGQKPKSVQRIRLPK